MEVRKIQNTPNFTGYVDKSISLYLSKAVSNSMDKVVERANLSCKKVDKKELKRLKDLGQEVFDKFQEFMSKTHDNTKIELRTWLTGYTIQFKNPLINNFVEDCNLGIITDLPKNNAGERELCQLNRIATEFLDGVDPHDIDVRFLSSMDKKVGKLAKNASNVLKRWYAKYKATTSKCFAEQIGEPVGENTKNVEKLIQEGRQERKLARQNRLEIKQIFKENENAKKEIQKEQ